ncbi:MAG: UDP-N-acetylglucosamine 2-epimerase (hydrolyzing) [Candidatus Riflebacteria bacterium]|nr:UDP-N-acetylglucosamine 2-epimerase (hydrolyzing) [Candidatus Riflebacteria bacterium]
MKKTICIFTATRAEYGLLKAIIKALIADETFNIKVVATAAHLSPEFGMTYQEIEDDGIKIDRKIETLLSSDTPSAVSKSMGLTMIGFADYFAETKPDAFMVLGDRYEALAAVCAAFNARIPIIHLYGGDTTEGAADEAYRHSISKMSYLHFTSTEEYRKRVIQLGESPERVFEVGEIGIENAINTRLLSLKELSKSLGIELSNNFALGTFHPVTLENNSSEKQIKAILKALNKHKDMQFIFTKANADTNGRIINKILEDYCEKHERFYLFSSLGMLRYLSAIKHAKFVIGNSSSGLIEAPSYKIPTINIGDRQKGRLMASSVICCEPTQTDVEKAVEKALSPEFRKIAAKTLNPYGDGKTSMKIVKIIKKIFSKPVDLKKKFYDIPIKKRV